MTTPHHTPRTLQAPEAEHAAEASSLDPVHAVLRFAIEIAALVCWAIVGWHLGAWIFAIAFPLLAATAWGVFRVPGDRSANGEAKVPVPGLVRLFVEFDVLVGAAIATMLVWRVPVGLVLAIAVVVHYAATHRRVRWLLAQR